ncbi:rhamnulokinase family protein [Glycomyces sp. NPDC046736]|uniref:rhamnulokinase n=1 Tax=Glycomyces sp. NPDC046736 TaxID=3155615 RepID=UPI0033ED55CB
MSVVAAVDLGASSGRVMAARVHDGRVDLVQVARFANRAVPVRGRLYWDVLGLWSGILDGLRAVGDAVSVGVDSWAVDYGLLDAEGHLIANPVSYRDARNSAARKEFLAEHDEQALFARTGIQSQPFNTVFQLAAESPETLTAAKRLLLMPDLCSYWLSGVMAWEATNASTTGLVDLQTHTWIPGLAPDLLGPITATGAILGPVLPEITAATGLAPNTNVVATASHDTAAAIAAIPYQHTASAFISCGTWSLVGIERDTPVTGEAAREAGYTNERGADGSVRFLRNVAGLWLLSESFNAWRAQGLDVDLGEVLDRAAKLPPLVSVVDPDDARFAGPGDMPERIRGFCVETGQPVPESPVEVAACVVDSLALAHRRAIEGLERLTDIAVSAVHLVGGGANNHLLCQRTADATGLSVWAGPDEATALGNALVQAQAVGLVAPGSEARHAVARASARPRLHTPQGSQGPWVAAAARLHSN